MNGKNEFKTLAVILIKYNSNVKGKEGELKDFILSLPVKRNAVEKGENGCSTCVEPSKEDKYCLDLNFISAGTLVGFFDFNVTLRAKDIETIENFIIKCLRNGERKDLISETQTIAGTIFPNFIT